MDGWSITDAEGKNRLRWLALCIPRICAGKRLLDGGIGRCGDAGSGELGPIGTWMLAREHCQGAKVRARASRTLGSIKYLDNTVAAIHEPGSISIFISILTYGKRYLKVYGFINPHTIRIATL